MLRTLIRKSFSRRSATATNSFPAEVIATRLVLRSNSRTPRTSSTRMMVRVNAGCEVFRNAAAAMKLLYSATARTACNWRAVKSGTLAGCMAIYTRNGIIIDNICILKCSLAARKLGRADSRIATMISKPFDMGRKLTSAQRAVSPIRAGSRIYIGTGCAAPRSLLAALETMQPGPANLEFVSFLTSSALPQIGGASRTHYGHRVFFVGSEMRGLAASGQLDYVPISLEEVPRLLTSGRLPIDVALLQVPPPDARGFVSLGVSVDLAPAILSVARTAIAEVNPAMPRTHGESLVHLDRFDALVKVDAPVTEYVHPKIGEIAERVARYIASIIDDGSTLQIGLGRVPNGALRYLKD